MNIIRKQCFVESTLPSSFHTKFKQKNIPQKVLRNGFVSDQDKLMKKRTDPNKKESPEQCLFTKQEYKTREDKVFQEPLKFFSFFIILH